MNHKADPGNQGPPLLKNAAVNVFRKENNISRKIIKKQKDFRENLLNFGLIFDIIIMVGNSDCHVE